MDPSSYNPSAQDDRGFWGSLGAHFIDLFETFVIIGAIFLLFYQFVGQPHRVSGNSMVPTYLDGDFILTDKLTYRFNHPQRGEVVILKNPRDESIDFIKRVIALPGDSIQILGGSVYLNEKLLIEPYLPADTVTQSGNFLREGETVTVGSNQYFVFGDNRAHSSDSREWGPATKEEIIGRAFLRYFPPQRVRPLVGL
ncbi:MAG: signal peptidase I [Candidatus Daviesbacteria bacterium]|nr:MAG: signal peptidase I [Candidatus Daviesbacteria bacterium]